MDWRKYILRILLPTGLVLVLFVAFLFGMLLPDFERAMMDRKRDLIRELTRSAVSVLKEYHAEEVAGRMTREEAKAAAATRVRDLRYGPDAKDYFWITDMHPRMVMHPFRQELEGQDLTTFEDPGGNHVFVEFVRLVREAGEGYADYVWQWKDDPGRVVPKQSFVMGFAPWGWAIGTGIYTEDVRAEISALTERMVRVSLVITALAGLILLFVAHQGLRIERQRGAAEAALRESHERYRALVEASTEGTLMVLGNQCAYSNPTMLQMLGHDEASFSGLALLDLVDAEDAEARRYMADALAGRTAPARFEARFLHRDGHPIDMAVTTTPVALADGQGLIVTARDITRTKQAEAELGEKRERYRALRQAIDVGVFRTTAGRRGRLVEANPTALTLFGLDPDGDPSGFPLMDLAFDEEDRGALADALAAQGTVKGRVMRIRRQDGTARTVRLSAVLVTDESGTPRHCDGLVQDITDERRREAEREALLEELQTSLLFLDEPVSRRAQRAATCPLDTPVAKAADRMQRADRDAILLTKEDGTAIGILTDGDLAGRVLAQGRDPSTPAHQVMSAPLARIDEQALAWEAIQQMRDLHIRHLGVTDASGQISSIVSSDDLLAFTGHSSAILVREAGRGRTVDDVAAARSRLPFLVKALTDWGARPRTVTRVITLVSDAVTRRLVELAIEEMGPPPAPFAFLSLGSEGREEQTLATDQDNAIIYEDVAPERRELAAAWFLDLGRRVCDGLRTAGYRYCPGEAMARNPKWNQSLSTWKQMFGRWIATGTPQDLLSVNMFFDFRTVAGEPELALSLRSHIDGELRDHPSFFLHFAQNALLYKPPIGMFGKIMTGSGPDRPDSRTFSVKDAMMPLVNFARLYALRHEVERTSTLDRLDRLHESGVLSASSHAEFGATYSFLMGLRLRHQARLAARGLAPDNHVNPKDLNDLEEAMVKKALAQASLALKKISFEFLGSA